MKKIIIFGIIGILFLSFSLATDEIGIRERELKELEGQLNEIDNKLDNNLAQQYTIVAEINRIENSIRELDEKITNLNNEINQKEIAIKNAEDELITLEEELAYKRDILAKRLRVMYKAGDVGYIEVLLGSKDFKDLLNRVEVVKKIVKHDKDLIQLIEENVTKIDKVKIQLTEDKEIMEEKVTELDINKGYLRENERELTFEKNNLRQNEKALKALEDQLEEDANKVTEIIKNLKTKAQYVGGRMTWPAPTSYTITSPFGFRIHPIHYTKKLHTGVDIAAAWGEPIVAAQTGTIIYAGWLGGYGKAVMIDHGGGYVTLYGHLSSWNVGVGQKVNKGDTIGKCGTTGVSTGPHLHFEVREDGEYVDPMQYLKN
ncbi:MAG TPA: peptidoglycan DD-metalloendopeptidase family protein [Clostridia bacterium]|nr:peptidoglycan DD-metalloendopeptidase family protein [Clostridia bacterium]